MLSVFKLLHEKKNIKKDRKRTFTVFSTHSNKNFFFFTTLPMIKPKDCVTAQGDRI